LISILRETDPKVLEDVMMAFFLTRMVCL
jgi:hypothetical protein